MTRRNGLIGLALAWALLAAGALAPIASAQSQPITLQLNTQNNSGIAGTATLSEAGGRTRVAIQVTGAGPGPEPAHIHPGSCAQLDATPAFTLSNVVNGASTTDVDTTLQALTSGSFAVHMHKSQDELTVYVACADIAGSARPGTLPRSGDLGGSWPAAIAGLAGLVLSGVGIGLRRRAVRGA